MSGYSTSRVRYCRDKTLEYNEDDGEGITGESVPLRLVLESTTTSCSINGSPDPPLDGRARHPPPHQQGRCLRAHHEERSFFTTETAARITIVAFAIPMKNFTEVLALAWSMRTTFSATGLA